MGEPSQPVRPRHGRVSNYAIEAAEPNPGHYALAEMEQEGLIKYILTQNVDNLHRKAGSTKVAEIHGNRTKLRCINCVSRFEHEEIPLDPLPPRCPHCQGLVKGDGVMFGEPIPSDVLALCEEQASLCDAMVLIGTSAVVYPAAGFPLAARRRGAFLVEVNPLETALSDACDIALRAPLRRSAPVPSRARQGDLGRHPLERRNPQPCGPAGDTGARRPNRSGSRAHLGWR